MVQLLTSVPQSTVHQLEKRLANQMTELVIGSESIEAEGPEHVVVRDILPADDLDSGDQNGWSDDEEWRQDWNTDGTADAYNEAYEIDSSGRADDKIVAFYKVMLPASVDTRQIRFGVGINGNQGTKAWLNVQEAEHDEESTGVFSDAVIYGPSEHGNIEHYLDAANDNKFFQYGGLVGEAVGETLSNPSNPKL